MSGGRLLARLCSPAAILALAVLVRVAFVISMGDRLYFADTAEYETAARRMLQGLGPVEGGPRAPLYPALMALGSAIDGAREHRVLRLMQIVLGSLIVWGSGRLARRIGGAPAERPALLLTAFSPLLVFTTGLLYPTTLHTVLLLGFAMVADPTDTPRPVARGAVAGVLLALGILTDPVFVAPAAAVLVWQVLASRGARGAALLRVAMTGLAAAAILVPVSRLHRSPGPGGGAFMQKAQYVLDWSRSDSSMASRRQVRIPATTEFHPLSAREFFAREAGLLRERPVAYLSDVVSEFLHFFAPLPDRIQTQNRYNRASILWVGALHFVPLLLLALIGAWRGAGPAASRASLVLIVVATAGFYSLFFTQTRYRIPVEPMMAVLASLALVRIAPRLLGSLAGVEASTASPDRPAHHRRT